MRLRRERPNTRPVIILRWSFAICHDSELILAASSTYQPDGHVVCQPLGTDETTEQGQILLTFQNGRMIRIVHFLELGQPLHDAILVDHCWQIEAHHRPRFWARHLEIMGLIEYCQYAFPCHSLKASDGGEAIETILTEEVMQWNRRAYCAPCLDRRRLGQG
jgi:hypothetical protein